MKLNQLRHVVAVANRGSLRSAARFLGISQPSITRSIQELEAELGLKLFERNRVGIVPTAAGIVFLRRAQAMEAEYERALHEMAQLKGDDTGSVSIGMSTAAQLAILPRIINPFRRRYPKIWISIAEGLFPEMEHDVRDGLIDIYVGPVLADISDGSLIVKKLFEHRRIVVARADHPLGNARSIRELADASWITTQVMAESEREVRTVYAEAAMPPPDIVGQAKSGMTIISMVAFTDLLCPLPESWRPLLRHIPLIREVPIAEITYAPDICSVRRTHLPLTPAAQYLNDLVEKAAANYVLEMAASATADKVR